MPVFKLEKEILFFYILSDLSYLYQFDLIALIFFIKLELLHIF